MHNGPGATRIPTIGQATTEQDRERLSLALIVLQSVPPVAVDNKLVTDDVYELRLTAARVLKAHLDESSTLEGFQK